MLKVLGFFSKFFTKCVGYNQATELLKEKDTVIEKLEKNIANKNSELGNIEASHIEVVNKLSSAEIQLSGVSKLNDKLKEVSNLLESEKAENTVLNNRVKELEKKLKREQVRLSRKYECLK